MVNNERNFAEAERQHKYELFVQAMRERIAEPVGKLATDATNVALVFPTLGLVVASQPYSGEFTPKPEESTDSFETYTRALGETGLAEVINLSERRPTPREAILAQAS